MIFAETLVWQEVCDPPALCASFLGFLEDHHRDVRASDVNLAVDGILSWYSLLLSQMHICPPDPSAALTP